MPLLIIASLSYWALLIYTLSPQWSAYPQYNYGWAVPVLCAFLFWRQALERPQPSPARARRLNCLSIALLAILLLPTLIIQEANPIWRLASWTMALITVGITLGAIYAVGGRSWLRQFLFPCLYFLVAVPWPSALETWTIQTLTQWNAATTTEIVHWLGVPAIQRGNVIEVSTGVVGIDDACSGIRSFQATLMVSLFFGVVYRLSMSWRLGLVLSGFLF